MTIQAALQFASEELRRTSDAPLLDAQHLLLHVLEKSELSFLIGHAETNLSENEVSSFKTLIKTRKSGKPLAYILGNAEFFGRMFIVNENVLIPRPETENLICKSLEIIKTLAGKYNRKLTVADIGTGSGCIAITLFVESPFVEKVYATDISQPALAVAKQNAANYSLSSAITFLEGTLLEPIKNKPVDLIVSNPPYVPSSELINLNGVETKGLAFEPKNALDGGPDGLSYVKELTETSLPIIIETLQGAIETHNI